MSVGCVRAHALSSNNIRRVTTLCNTAMLAIEYAHTSNWFDGLAARWPENAENTLRLNVVIDECPHNGIQTATAGTFDHLQFHVGQYFRQRFVVDSLLGHCRCVNQI